MLYYGDLDDGYGDGGYGQGPYGDPANPPTDVDIVRHYLGSDASWSDTQIAEALDAEKLNQAKVCYQPPPEVMWPADLSEALKRRVARNLAMRGLPLGFQPMATDIGAVAFRPGHDSEIRRLEGPYRRVAIG